MIGKTGHCIGVGVAKSIPHSRCGPVAMVRMQKAGIKYKKPIVFLPARKCFQRRSIGRDGVMDWQGGRSNFGAVGIGPAS